jgi:hypothetical protein
LVLPASLMVSLPPLTLQFLRLISDHQRSKHVSQDTHLLRCSSRHLENQGQHLFWAMFFVTYSNLAPGLPFRKWTFSLRSGTRELWEVVSPCPLHLINNKPYFLFLKTLLSLFVS